MFFHAVFNLAYKDNRYLGYKKEARFFRQVCSMDESIILRGHFGHFEIFEYIFYQLEYKITQNFTNFVVSRKAQHPSGGKYAHTP